METDITKCEYYNKTGKCKIPHFENNIKFTSCNCKEWNCYFKQLQQLKEENEKLKEKQRILDEEDYVYEITEKDYNEFRTLKEENEKLRKQLADKHLDYESEYNRKLEEKEHRVYLEKKLEKIKELCLKNHCNAQIAHSGCGYDYLILQIIESEE